MILEMIQKAIDGDVKFDPMSLHLYSVDASIFEISPMGIVFPKSAFDIQETIKIAAEYGVPIIPRGAATGIAGGAIGEGIIIDLSKYLNHILHINEREKYAICEPGVIQDDLNSAVSTFGLRLGPETSTGNRATLGGMVAANAAGSHYLHFGSTADHLLEIQMVMSDGTLQTFGDLWPHPYKEKIEEIEKVYKEEIALHFPKIKRRSSGYLLDRLSTPAQFIAGSEGTLGIITQIKCKLVSQLRKTSLALLFFDCIEDALEKVPALLKLSPLSLELIDEHVIKMGRLSPFLRGHLSWLPENRKVFLVFEFFDDTPPLFEGIYKVIQDVQEQKQVWALRKAGLGLLLSRRSYSRAVAFIEDIAIPPENLCSFVSELKALLASKGKEAGIYGHAGDGCLHIRPYLDLRKEEEIKTLIDLMEKTTILVKSYGGVLSGEHGDGWIRSWLNPTLFGPTIYKAFEEIKQVFDPLKVMNPGKVVGAKPLFDHLRASPKNTLSFKTFLDFEKEGGIHLAADLCNGNGECRKKTGLMCPSFHAENEEEMSTRARAQALRSILNGKMDASELTGKRLYEVLEFCLECKGCKTECPSQIDMAKMKSEISFHYQEKHGYSLRTQLFGKIHKFLKWGSLFPTLANWMGEKKIWKEILDITPARPFPHLAKESFSRWWRKREPLSKGAPVVLFIDTFTEYLEPEIGKSAVSLLEALGYRVTPLTSFCCGRTAFSKGMLKTGKKQAFSLLDRLAIFVKEKVPIIGLEPSCLYTLKDDYASFFNHPIAEALKVQCHTFEEFLSHSISNLSYKPASLFIHTHCHQKALQGTFSFSKAIEGLPGFQIIDSGAGCCGLAGSFGYEKEHYRLSMEIGNTRLFPSILKHSSSFFIASGHSCRAQMAHGTGQKTYHPAEIFNLLRLD